MKIKQLFFPALMLIVLMLALSACELPFDIPFLGGEKTTTAETTTAPVTTTTGALITLPAVTAKPNPIVEVKAMNNGLRLICKNSKAVLIEPSLTVSEGQNSVTYTHSFDKESGILTLTLFDSARENIALSHLGEDLPESISVCLREKNGNIEWAYAGSDSFFLLCKIGDNSALPLAALCKATDFGRTAIPTERGVTLVIDGNRLRFRSHYWQKEGYDLCNDAVLHSHDTNQNFLMRIITEIPSAQPADSMMDGILFKTTSDEIPAISINGTYIAAAHGYYLISDVPNTISFTEEDIGRVFTRASDGQQYVLVKVPDSNVWFCPFDEEAMESGDFTQYGYPAKGLLKQNDLLTYTVDGREKSFTVSKDAVQTQFRKATNHAVQRAFLNGTVEVDLTKNGVYSAEFVDCYERYSALYLPAVLNYLMDRVGKNTNDSSCDESIDEHYLSYIHTHRYHKNGSYTVYQTIEFHADVKNIAFGGVISEPFSGTAIEYVYAPGAENCGTPTLHDPSLFDTYQEKYAYAYGDYTIRSFFHFPDATLSKGMNVGYYPYFGVATDEIRKVVIEEYGSVCRWSNLRKMYPHLYKTDSAAPGDTISFIGYHIPTMQFDDDFFAINWYFVGDEIYLSMHTDRAVGERTVTIPNAEYLIGLAVTVDDASDGFTVLSDTVTADGITVSTTGAGYVTLKLTKQ